MPVIDVTPVMTSNTAPSPYVITTNSDYSKSYMGWHSMDGNPDSYWCTVYGVGEGILTLKRTDDEQFTISSITIDTKGGSYDWSGVTVYLSDDGTEFGEVFNDTVLGGLKRIDLGMTYKCKAIRIRCTDPIPGSTGGFGIYTLKLEFNTDYPNFGDAKYPLSIHKTLKENLPQSIDPSKDEVHFTDDGEIYISKQDGSLMKCYSNIVASVGLDRKEW